MLDYKNRNDIDQLFQLHFSYLWQFLFSRLMRFVFKQLHNDITISGEMKALQNSISKVIFKCVISVQKSETFE